MERTSHERKGFVLWSALAFAVAVTFLNVPYAPAQSLTTGAISGVVSDPTGAVVPHATVTATQLGTGAERTVNSQADGSYTVSLLLPGQYDVKVTSSGFRTAEQSPITVELSANTSLNIKLEVGQASQTVEVSGAAPLIETSNPNNTTNVSANAIASLPNPGNDLSYVAQVAPGAVMNTTGGYGNAEFNGLPATSSNFTIDGMDANDPFLNLNNSGATNLQLGLNSMQEASINTLSYSADQGRQGAAQINFISKSGTNQIHGNLFETWNGSVMNGVDWFVNAQPLGTTAHRARSNVNQFGGSIGGKILHDKLFYFFDMEGIRIVVPTTLSENYPSQAYESQVLTDIPKGGLDPLNGVTYAPPPNPQAAISYYQKAFALYGTPSGGIPNPINGCTLGTGASVANGAGDGCGFTRTFPFSNQTHDLYWKARVDHDVSAADKLWYSFNWEKGVQATYTDPVNTVFNAYSTQPANGAAVGWTHVFSPNVVNDFNPGYYWYSAIFAPSNQAAALAASPFEFDGVGFSDIYNPAAFAWPQGRNVTDYQIVDNLTITKSSHTLKFGGNLRRTLVSDFDTGIYSIPYVSAGDVYQYAFDANSFSQLGFPTSTSEPIKLVSLDLYAMDTWKVKSNVTLTLGVRSTWNSDPLEGHSNFSELKNGSFFTLNHDVNVPYNQIINPHNKLLAYSTPLIEWQPRGSIAWSVKPNTVIRIGGGVFSDIFPASLSDALLRNFPNDNIFGTSFNTPAPGVASNFAIPGSGNGVPGSINNDALGNLAYSQQALVAGFGAGVPSCAATNAPTNCIPPNGYTTTPDGTFKYPVFYEWSAGVEQQIGNNWAVKVNYVGTHASELPYIVGPNSFQTICQGCFSPYPYNSIPDARFQGVTQNSFGANSIYNALQTSLEKRTSHGLTMNLNYTWSHCLDTLSNEGSVTGGFNPNTSIAEMTPGVPLSNLYGNCDYDIRNSLNGNYIFQLPSLVHDNKILGAVINGWQISGDLFIHSGYPFSVTGPGYSAGGNGVFNTVGGGAYVGSTPTVFLAQPTGANPYAEWQKGLPSQTPGKAEIQWLNPNSFSAVVDGTTGACYAGEVSGAGANPAACQFAANGRNNVFGPGYWNTNFFLGKNFKISERATFRIEAQAYNVFNHMNPAQPGTGAGIPGIAATESDAFTINHAQLQPTGLLGSGLGGDNSVRMIALRGMLTF
ncbi:MAG TPA: carboxypeptidase regulatory-like domain-containing protein [Terriglobia bacterium]|nr:carboxypeptidase regulatory-like domain-containing protein [Terriglobia bacterium]